ncbi:MAG: asparagine synthase (glutamine-hydrolyzing) [Phycisphaerae bacterium]|nr:asparagine synthase (glutamine-hydrolyzing) [Phycisphaerae bacterium]
MCGIFGVFDRSDSEPEVNLLGDSLGALSHRGPDGKGMFTESGIGLAHSRLSLLDLSEKSNQPFHSSDSRYVLVYNGEIYNYQEIRSELERKQIVFRSEGDTEVLLASLINEGIDKTLIKLEGMFAFALYDRVEKTLTLARDRFGIKPLYIYNDGSKFIFSSEIKAMRPWFRFEPEHIQIANYVSGGNVSVVGETFYRGIKTVSPGTVIHVKPDGNAEYKRYFTLGDMCDPGEIQRLKSAKPIDVINETEELLLESVKMRMIADVPVGALCSGGVDSSVIMAMACKYHNNLAVFHADVTGPDSEYDAARKMAKHLNLDMLTVKVTDDDYIDTFAEVTEHYGHPFAYHPNSTPFLAVSKLIGQNNIKAVLSGEGSDECFTGYNKLVFNIPEFIKENLRESIICHFYKIKRMLKGLPAKKRLPNKGLEREFLSGFTGDIEDLRNIEALEKATGKKITDSETSTLKFLNYHLQTLLHRNDCLGMAAGIESRFPFLYSKFVKLAINMPYNYKVRFSPTCLDKRHYFMRDKWVLRKVADRYLPKELSQRRKLGFPVSAFRRMEVSKEFFTGSFVSDFLSLTRADLDHIYSKATQKQFMKLVFLEVWAQVCLLNNSKDAVTGKLRSNIEIRSE